MRKDSGEYSLALVKTGYQFKFMLKILGIGKMGRRGRVNIGSLETFPLADRPSVGIHLAKKPKLLIGLFLPQLFLIQMFKHGSYTDTADHFLFTEIKNTDALLPFISQKTVDNPIEKLADIVLFAHQLQGGIPHKGNVLIIEPVYPQSIDGDSGHAEVGQGFQNGPRRLHREDAVLVEEKHVVIVFIETFSAKQTPLMNADGFYGQIVMKGPPGESVDLIDDVTRLKDLKNGVSGPLNLFLIIGGIQVNVHTRFLLFSV